MLGALIAIKHDWIVNNIGRIATIDQKFGSFGGTRMFLILLGTLISIFSVMYITGVFPGILVDPFLAAFGR